MPSDSLARANASLHRGAKVAAGIVVPLCAVSLVYLLTHGLTTWRLADLGNLPLAYWVLVLLVSGVLVWITVEWRRLTSTNLTSDGIERGDGNSILRWADVASAEYGSGWFRFQDRGGQRTSFSVAFAASARDVVEAVQDYLPKGVRLSVY